MSFTRNASKSLRFISLLAIASLAMTGCAGSSSTAGNQAPSASPEPVMIAAPLTGVKYEEGSEQANALKSPAVTCKIDNSYDARPQQGLNQTDTVFVEMVEGGLTRLVATWHSSKPEAVGPVRSIRPMDPDIISPYGGIVCYSGGQLAFVKLMQQTQVFNASETSEQGKGTFSRTKERIAPHNVIVNVSKLAANHPELAAPQNMFDFAASAQKASAATSASSPDVTSFAVSYPSALSEWVWSPNTVSANGDAGAWVRNQDKEKHTDSLTGEQIRATNVIVMQVQIDRSYADHKYGHIPKSVLVSSGKATVFTGGRMIEGTWQKSSQTSRIIFTDASGAAIEIAPGNTWIELMPNAPEGKLTIKSTPRVAKPSPSATN
jgi:hypothetical protein